MDTARPAPVHDVVAPLALLTPLNAFVLSLPVLGGGAIYAAGVGLAAALVAASPLLAWWLRRGGGTRWFHLTLLGLTGGASVPIAWGVYVGVMDGSFAPSVFHVVFVLLCAAIGAATGAEYWLLMLRTPDEPRRNSLAAWAVLGLVAATIVVPATWPETMWPRYREQTEQAALSWSLGPATDETGVREVQVWVPLAPRCVASVYLPSLAPTLERDRPRDLVVEITRIKERWGLVKRTRVDRIHTTEVPRGATTFIQGCPPWAVLGDRFQAERIRR